MLLGAGAVAAAAGLALLGPAGIASAQPDAAALAFEGNTPTSCTTPIPAVPALNQTGSYCFSGTASGLSADASPAGATAVANGSISSSGTYDSVICGTGTATGSASIQVAGNGTSVSVGGGGPSSYHVNYTIQFVSGVGIFVPTETTVTASDGSSGPAAGPVVIVPTNGNCVTPVNQFTVVGAAVGATS